MSWDPDFERAFHPRAVAMFGVSSRAQRGARQNPGSTNFLFSFEELGYKGRIYLIHPTATEILGHKAYPSLSALPEPVDLVVVGVPAPQAPAVLRECAAAGARNVEMFTSGFEETGEEERARLGQEVRKIIQEGGLRVVGPNCMGLYVPSARIGPFNKLTSKSGPLAFVSQSGGHMNWLAHNAPDYGVYLSKGISFGNAYVLDSTDYLEYLSKDPETRAISMYLEGVKDGRKLLSQVKEINPVKPVILWKGGLTEAGSGAVASHTASLAGQKAIWDGFYRQTGAIPAQSGQEVLDAAMAVLNLRRPRSRRVGIIGGGGGNSVESADVANREGLTVLPLAPETRRQLREFIPPAGTGVRNPLDTGVVYRDLDQFERCLKLVTNDPAVDMLILMPHLDFFANDAPELVDRVASYIKDYARKNAERIPTVVAFSNFANDREGEDMRTRLRLDFCQAGLPTYHTLGRASRALARFCAYHEFLKA